MHHPEFPAISFVLIFLLLWSLPSHIKARSVSLISLTVWLAAANTIRGVNSIVWAGNVFIRLEVWCDITTKVLIGFTIAVPLSVLCISRQLEKISSNRQSVFTEADKRRRKIIELILCFGVPLPFMALHYVFQGHRFDIIEDIGCNPATYISIPTIICILIPPVLISMASMIYSLAAIHHFLKRRIEFASILRNATSAMTPARYFRLLLFALSDIFFNLASNLLSLYFNIQNGVNPYVSWKFVHLDFSRIGLFPIILLPSTDWKEILYLWWVPPVGTILFVILFGFNQDVISDYTVFGAWLKRGVNFFANPFCTAKYVLPTHVRIKSSLYITRDELPSLATPPKSWNAEDCLKTIKLVESSSTHDSQSPNFCEHISISYAVRPLPSLHLLKQSRSMSSYTT